MLRQDTNSQRHPTRCHSGFCSLGNKLRGRINIKRIIIRIIRRRKNKSNKKKENKNNTNKKNKKKKSKQKKKER